CARRPGPHGDLFLVWPQQVGLRDFESLDSVAGVRPCNAKPGATGRRWQTLRSLVCSGYYEKNEFNELSPLLDLEPRVLSSTSFLSYRLGRLGEVMGRLLDIAKA